MLGPEWATRLENVIFDDSGRLAARKGWNILTSNTTITDDFISMVELVKRNGSTELVATTNTQIFRSTDDGSSWAECTGTAVFTNGDWQFVNFNDKIVGFQKGKTPIVYDGGVFAPIEDTNAPVGGVGLSAFGRLWAVDSNGTTIKYSGLLDETDWSSDANAGQIDVMNIWPRADTVTGLAAFNGALVVFGKWSILFFTDGRGSAIGLDPITTYIADTVTGTGCIAQKSIQNVDGDLWFLSSQGLMSLRRLINERSNPLDNLSKNVQDYLRDLVEATPISQIRSAYFPRERFYMLSLPNGIGGGESVVFDTRGQMEDGSARCAGIWTGLAPSAVVSTHDENLIMALYNKPGVVGEYSGRLDDTASYVMEYESGWLDLDRGTYLKFLKRLNGTFYADRTATVTFKWAFDFDVEFDSQSYTFTSVGQNSEWGIAEFGIAEYSGGVDLRRAAAAGSGGGEYVKVGLSVNIDNLELAVQELEIFAKIGRLAS
jgi:hypothetical protein